MIWFNKIVLKIFPNTVAAFIPETLIEIRIPIMTAIHHAQLIVVKSP